MPPKVLLLIRALLFIPNILLAFQSLFFAWSSLIIFLTQWGLHFTNLSFYYVLKCQEKPESMRYKRLAFILTELAFNCQVIITAIYWPVLHPIVKAKIQHSDPVLYFHMLYVHSVPFVTLCINLVFSRVTFLRGHWCYTVFFGMIYPVFNYFGSWYRGKNLYPIIRWEYKLEVFLVIVAFNLFSGFILHPLSC